MQQTDEEIRARFAHLQELTAEVMALPAHDRYYLAKALFQSVEAECCRGSK